jgi:microbial collagenase
MEKTTGKDQKKGRHKLYKIICLFCIIALLLSNVFSDLVLAINDNPNGSSVSNQLPIGKIGNREKIESSIFSREITDDLLSIKSPEPPESESIDQSSHDVRSFAARESTYSMSYLKTLNYTDLVDLLVTLKYSDITDLFQYSQDAYEFYSNQSRMEALIDAINLRGRQYTSTDNKGIPTLCEVVRAGFYLGFYNSQLSELNSRNYHDKCLPSIVSVMNNANFKLGTAQQDDLVSSIGLLMWNGSTNVDIINRTIPIFQQFQSNINTYINDNAKGTAIYNLGGGIEYDINEELYNGVIPSKTIWYGKIDDFITQVSNIALLGNFNSDNGWLINNGLYWMGTLGKVHSNPSEGNRVLTQAMSSYPYLGEPYFQAASSIVDNYDGLDYYGRRIDIKKITQDGINKYLPKKYTFDDDKLIIYAGDDVTIDKVKRLYWASHEVRAQFYRAIGSDTPLEANNTDEVLICYIYNSPYEYGMNRYLFGLDTNNGGIYIESWGSFYTYERTPQDSIYTLEELFRHEFTHYLQGRYLVPGMWGESEIYDNERLTWFEEGGAEWFAGSTRTDGIVPRKTMVSNIGRVEDRYSLFKTLHSSYDSGFTFYTYGFVVYNYMHEKNRDMLNSLNNAVKTNNVREYDNLISQYSNDNRLNAEYQNQMQYLVDNINIYYVPLVADDYLETHTRKDLESIYSDITSAADLTNVTITQSQSEFFKTFTLRGTYTKAETQGPIADWKYMDLMANESLNTLASYPWSGYETVVCYFTNYKVNSSNEAEFDVVFHGIFTGDETTQVNNPPVAEANGPYIAMKGEEISFSSMSSKDSDGTIISYLWDFGDGSTSVEANPNYTYSTAGIFTATLTVVDDKGERNTDEAQVIINEPETNPSDGITSEAEPNDIFDNANGPIMTELAVSARFQDDDNVDIYYFDVISNGQVDINVTPDRDLGISWMLYEASDIINYVTYPTSTTGGRLTGSYDAAAGRYYLYIYKYSGTGSYTIDVNGPLK